MTYAGLTTADKGALLDAKARGANWLARDKERKIVYGYAEKPTKYKSIWAVGTRAPFGSINFGNEKLQFIQWSDAEPVNIDLALAQIAEMERIAGMEEMLKTGDETTKAALFPAYFAAKANEQPPLTLDEVATDDIVLAEVYSLREKLKIAASIIHQLDPNYDVTEFLHQVGSADFDQREEDLTPLTWNDWFTDASLEERAAFILRYVENSCESWCMDYQPMGEHLGGCDQQCAKHLEHHLNSPYTEGATK